MCKAACCSAEKSEMLYTMTLFAQPGKAGRYAYGGWVMSADHDAMSPAPNARTTACVRDVTSSFSKMLPM